MTSSFDYVRQTAGGTLRGSADYIHPEGSLSIQQSHDTTYLTLNIPPEMTQKHRQLLFDDKGRPHGPDYIREQAIRTAKEAWTRWQTDTVIDVSKFTVFASQITGAKDLGVVYVPEVLPTHWKQRSIALHAAQVISELEYYPTRAIALRQLRDKYPLVSSHWERMEYEASEAANQATEASKASTEVGSAPGKSKGKKLFKD